MRQERRWWLVGGLVASGVLCLWCGVFAGVGGWIAGRDMGRREARIEVQTTTAARATLPELGSWSHGSTVAGPRCAQESSGVT